MAKQMKVVGFGSSIESYLRLRCRIREERDFSIMMTIAVAEIPQRVNATVTFTSSY